MFAWLLSNTTTAAQERYDIDRTDGYTGPKYAVVFVARPVDVSDLSPGHTAISLQWEDSTAAASRMESWGYMPTGNKGFSSVPGQLINEWASENSTPSILVTRTVIVSVSVPPGKMSAVRGVIAQWRAKHGQYHVLTQNNCNSFAESVARALGLEVSQNPNTTRPEVFVRSLGKEND